MSKSVFGWQPLTMVNRLSPVLAVSFTYFWKETTKVMFSLGGLFEVMLLCVNGMAVLQVRSIPLGSTAAMEAVCLTRLQFMLQLLWCFFCVDISTMLAYQGEFCTLRICQYHERIFPHPCMYVLWRMPLQCVVGTICHSAVHNHTSALLPPPTSIWSQYYKGLFTESGS